MTEQGPQMQQRYRGDVTAARSLNDDSFLIAHAAKTCGQVPLGGTVTHGGPPALRWAFLALISAVVLGAFVACERPAPEPRYDLPVDGALPPRTQPPAAGMQQARTVYVPAYSHIPSGEGLVDRMMSILLSVRNIDVSTPVVLTHVDYFDTSGHRVRRYLDAPKVLQPLETVEFEVSRNDSAGGSGANFLVYWEGPSDAHAILAEALMLHRNGSGVLAFTSRGIELNERPQFPDQGLRPTAADAARVPHPKATDAGPSTR